MPAPGSRKDDPKYAEYFKKLKIGVPADAVKRDMKAAGLDPAILDEDPESPSPLAPPPGPSLGDESDVVVWLVKVVVTVTCCSVTVAAVAAVSVAAVAPVAALLLLL